MSQQYPFFEAAGSPRELGRQHGEQAATRIAGYLDYLAASLKLSREQLRLRAMRFLPLFEKLCPDLLTEVTGLAEGAKLSLADALVAQLRGELSQIGDGGCTTFAVGPRGTASGSVFVGQTSDNPTELEQFGYVLRLSPIGKPKLLMWTFGGMLGYHGMNEHGVSHFANALGGGPSWKFALSHYPLKRLILEQRSVADASNLMRNFPVCSNGNYMLADGDANILDVELTSDGPLVIEDNDAGFLVHSNHYLCTEHSCAANFIQSLPDSWPRLERMTSLIAKQFGAISLADMQRFASDHDGYPVSICRHAHDGSGHSMLGSASKTVATLIAEPQQRRLHVAFGNPCENPFVTYSL